VHELLQDAVRLSVLAAGAGQPAALAGRTIPRQRPPVDGLELAELLEVTHATVRDRDDRVQLALSELQAALAEQLGDAFEPHPGPEYRRLVRQVRRSVESVAPAGSTVLVVSRGDDELLQLDRRTARHFPCDAAGRYAGFHPSDSAAAVRHLEEQRASGATHLVLPSTALWWLDHYVGFAEHLRKCGELLLDDTAHCRVYRLREAA
jgi:hypothetical protein